MLGFSAAAAVSSGTSEAPHNKNYCHTTPVNASSRTSFENIGGRGPGTEGQWLDHCPGGYPRRLEPNEQTGWDSAIP